MEMVLSSEPASNFDLVGKCSVVMFDECWRRVPNSRFLGFSEMGLLPNEGREGI
jgi:hypothetical protein